jgi:hypothetical protein
MLKPGIAIRERSKAKSKEAEPITSQRPTTQTDRKSRGRVKIEEKLGCLLFIQVGPSTGTNAPETELRVYEESVHVGR